MAPRNTPPFRADHVGSLLRPKELVEARDKKQRGEISAEALREVEDKAIRDVVKLQEDIGLQVDDRWRVPSYLLACRFPRQLCKRRHGAAEHQGELSYA